MTKPKGGRPKGSKNHKTIVQEFALKKHPVIENGEKVQKTVAELILQTLKAKAMEGNLRCQKKLDQLQALIVPQDDGTGLLVVPEPLSADEWVRRAEIRNARAKPPGGTDDTR